jgi:LIVCS family branched-chain amino acid:cation transporter
MSKNFRDVVLVGFALFAMFFGAGNLIFPPFMGFMAGDNWSWAMLGFLLTGIGMPLLGIMASARAGGTVEKLSGMVSPTFARILSIVIILAIGPLLAIPRTAAVTFELGVRPSFPDAPAALSSIIFFTATLFFALNQSAVIDRIGKILTPFLVITLAWIILKGVFAPLGPIVDKGFTNPFGNGFREGYQTMDALASLVFAEIVIAALVFKGYKAVRDQVRLTSIAGLIAATGLGLVYGGLMYLGSTAGTLYPADVERTDLLIGITQGLLGNGGKVALGTAVSLACLTTSIALTATVGDYFSGLFKNKIGYKTICIITVIFSGIFATVGVTMIVNIAVPLLVTVYPVAITLVILTLIGGPLKNRAIYVGAVSASLATGIFDAFNAAGYPIETMNNVISLIPFADIGFPWFVPALVGGTAGAIVSAVRKPSEG